MFGICCSCLSKRKKNFGSYTDMKLGMREEIIVRASAAAMKAHTNTKHNPLLVKTIKGSSEVIIAFRGSWSVSDWVADQNSSPADIEETIRKEFPCLRSIGNNIVTKVNEAFLNAFLSIKKQVDEVTKAHEDNKQVIFTGHSGAGPIAIFATIWLHEKLRKERTQNPVYPFCVTFGSPLTADHILSHALRREKWSDRFIHFVNRYDIIPRIFLAPTSAIRENLQKVLSFLKSNIKNPDQLSAKEDGVARDLYETVLRHASCVASQAACSLMGSTNMVVETISSFIELSSYRPFGTYVFCTGDRNLVVVKNPDATLQLMVYSSLLSSEEDSIMIAHSSLKEHLTYGAESLGIQLGREVYYFQDVEDLPEELAEIAETDPNFIDEVLHKTAALDSLGLSARARMCLLAAREYEKHKRVNQKMMDTRMKDVEDRIIQLEQYRTQRAAGGKGYYDAFKLQNEEQDFRANISRLELAGVWDEVIEMLKRHQLPDEFEGDETWIQRGTQYRNLVEPLDIANYYRHAKGADSREYLRPGSRPKRYYYTQRWFEHARKMEDLSGESTCESNFWAVAEELKIKMTVKKVLYNALKDEISAFEQNLKKWYDGTQKEEVDAFLPESTLIKWWNTLPSSHRENSCIKEIINRHKVQA